MDTFQVLRLLMMLQIAYDIARNRGLAFFSRETSRTDCQALSRRRSHWRSLTHP